MDESHWLQQTVERLEAFLFDSVASKRISPALRFQLQWEREHLIDEFMRLEAHRPAQ